MSQCAKLKGNWDMWLWESKDNLLCFSRGQMWQGRALFNRETSQCNDFSKHLNVEKKMAKFMMSYMSWNIIYKNCRNILQFICIKNIKIFKLVTPTNHLLGVEFPNNEAIRKKANCKLRTIGKSAHGNQVKLELGNK